MAQELQVDFSQTAKTLYTLIWSSVGQVYRQDTQVFEAYATANRTATKYCVSLAELGTASRHYVGTFPTAITNGHYYVASYWQTGGSPAEGDVLVGAGEIDWTGSIVSYKPANFSAQAISSAGGVTLADGVTHGGTTATMRLGGSTSTPAFYVTNSGGDAVFFGSSSTSGHGLHLEAQGTTGDCFHAETNLGGRYGVFTSGNLGEGLYVTSASRGGMNIAAGGSNRNGLTISATGTGYSITADKFFLNSGLYADLHGKVIGDSSGTITGVGAWVKDGTGAAVATASAVSAVDAKIGSAIDFPGYTLFMLAEATLEYLDPISTNAANAATNAGAAASNTSRLNYDANNYVLANMMAINTATTAIGVGGAGVVTFLDNATVCTVGTLMPANVTQVAGENVHDDGDGRMEVLGDWATAAAVWDLDTTGHTTPGTFGAAMAAASSGDPWTTALPGAYDPGTAGYIVGTNLDAAVSAVQTDVAAVKADTTSLLARVTATLFAGITSLAEWLGLLAGKQAGDDTARTELRATGAGSGTFDETTDSLEALGEGSGAATPDDIAAAVWDLATAGHTTTGTFGEALANLPVVAPSWYSVPLDAAGTRDAIGMAAPNLDEQLAGLASGGMASPETIAAAVLGSQVLEIQTPSAHMTDAAGTQLTEVTARQALAALMVTLTGDRDGVGTRTIVATVPGAEDCTVTAHRETRSTIDATIVVPTTPD